MVEGRLRNFYAERVLCEQPFVKDDKLTVGKYAAQNEHEDQAIRPLGTGQRVSGRVPSRGAAGFPRLRRTVDHGAMADRHGTFDQVLAGC